MSDDVGTMIVYRITLYLDDSLDMSGCTNFRIHSRGIVEGHESDVTSPVVGFLKLVRRYLLFPLHPRKQDQELVCTKNC